jgi:hypothetical protein
LEAAYQFGSFGRARIDAFTIATDVGHTFSEVPWTPRLGLRANVASGDGDPSDGKLGTFEVPFPKLPYLLEANFVSPANIIDIHPTLTIRPRPDVRLSAEYIALFKHERADAFYLPPLRPVPSTIGGDSKFLAHFAQFGADWQATPQVTFTGSYVHAFLGTRLKRAGGIDSDFAFVAATVRF